MSSTGVETIPPNNPRQQELDEARWKNENEKRSALLVVATLFATTAFQAMLSPPRGIEDGISIFGAKDPTRFATFMMLNKAMFYSSVAAVIGLLTGISHHILWTLVSVALQFSCIVVGMNFWNGSAAVTPTHGGKEPDVWNLVCCMAILLGFNALLRANYWREFRDYIRERVHAMRMYLNI